VPVNIPDRILNSNIVPSANASGCGQWSFDPCDLSCHDEAYLTPNNMAEMTLGWSNLAKCSLTTNRLYLNSPPETPKNWVQINPNLNDYYSNRMEMRSTFWILGITLCWRQQEEIYSKCAYLSNVAHDIFSMIPRGVRVEASSSHSRDMIGGRKSHTTGMTLRENIVGRRYPWAYNWILIGREPE